MLSRIKLFLGVVALALALAVPGAAQARSSHGNHCGRGHAKHTKAVGKSCHKQRSRSDHATAGSTMTANDTRGDGQSEPAENEPAENENQAGDDNDAADEQNEADDQNENQAEHQSGDSPGRDGGSGSDG